MSRNVLITNKTLHPKAAETLKELGFQPIIAQENSEDDLIRLIQENEVVGLFVRIEKITRRIFENCPSLKIVVENGIGVDNIDVVAASDCGVAVANLSYGALAVSEHTMAMLLALGRDILHSNATLKAGQWLSFNQPSFRSIQIADTNLLIVGTGNIGRLVAKRAVGFDMNIKGYDPFVPTEVMASAGIEKAEDFHEALQWADFVCIHMPLTEQTHHMFSTEEFKLMKKSAYLLNISRGPVVDEKALYQALTTSEIAGAGLDVFEQEPTPADNPILQLDNVLATAHVAGTNATLMERLAVLGAQSIAEYIDHSGKYAIHVVNKIS